MLKNIQSLVFYDLMPNFAAVKHKNRNQND